MQKATSKAASPHVAHSASRSTGPSGRPGRSSGSRRRGRAPAGVARTRRGRRPAAAPDRDGRARWRRGRGRGVGRRTAAGCRTRRAAAGRRRWPRGWRPGRAEPAGDRGVGPAGEQLLLPQRVVGGSEIAHHEGAAVGGDDAGRTPGTSVVGQTHPRDLVAGPLDGRAPVAGDSQLGQRPLDDTGPPEGRRARSPRRRHP